MNQYRVRVLSACQRSHNITLEGMSIFNKTGIIFQDFQMGIFLE